MQTIEALAVTEEKLATILDLAASVATALSHVSPSHADLARDVAVKCATGIQDIFTDLNLLIRASPVERTYRRTCYIDYQRAKLSQETVEMLVQRMTELGLPVPSELLPVEVENPSTIDEHHG